MSDIQALIAHLSMLSVEDAICLRKWAAGHGVRCAAAARAKALAEATEVALNMRAYADWDDPARVVAGEIARRIAKLKDKE